MTMGEMVEQFGLVGLVLFAMGVAFIRLWNRYNEVTDGRLQDLRENNQRYEAVIREYAKSLDSLGRLLEGRRDA